MKPLPAAPEHTPEGDFPKWLRAFFRAQAGGAAG